MSLMDVARNLVQGVGTSLTRSFQAKVGYQRCVKAGDGFSTKTWPTTVTLTALVQYRQRSVKTPTGETAVSSTTLLFTDLAALAAAAPPPGGIGFEDRFKLPDGTTQPVLNVGGLWDDSTGRLLPTEVYL